MPVTTFHRSRVFGIGMGAGMSLEDVARVDGNARSARAKSPTPLIVFTLSSRENNPPPTVVRDTMRENIDRMFDEGVFQHIYIVLRGEGVGKVLARAMFNAMLVLTRYRKRLTMCGTMEDAVALAERDHEVQGVTAATLLEKLSEPNRSASVVPTA